MPDDKGKPVAKIGNVTRTPELKFGNSSGKAFAKFGLAVNPYVPEGQPKPETIFYEVTAFGSLAENIAECVHKGNRVLVIGTGKFETWTDREGAERTTKTILADAVGPDLRFVTAVLSGSSKSSADTGPGTETF
jgi:single-strand DNA-binding protein